MARDIIRYRDPARGDLDAQIVRVWTPFYAGYETTIVYNDESWCVYGITVDDVFAEVVQLLNRLKDA